MEDSLEGRERKIAHKSLENIQKKLKERKRHLLYLIHNFLKENTYNMAADTLFETVNLSSTIEVCDNVSLEDIFCDYLKHYELQFNHPPRITKMASLVDNGERSKSAKIPVRAKSKMIKTKADLPERKDEFDISVTALSGSNVQSNQEIFAAELPSPMNFNRFAPEWKEIWELIVQQIIPKTLGVKWSDCIGLDSVITLLQEAVFFPQKYPDLFHGVTPWKGVLLYGPPGTGKTLLAKALACETDSKFFSVSASTFVSKWRGESEKLVKALFEMARQCKPCTIFIDELEALASKREDQQHEASRRFKSELLSQMDGILGQDDEIFILATSNLPWEIDAAILRRFEKKVYVDVPNLEARRAMFKKYLQLSNEDCYSAEDLDRFSSQTGTFSGNDIRLVCKEAKMKVVRRRIAKRELQDGRKGKRDEKMECAATVEDVEDTLLKTRPSSYPKEKYTQWQAKFGGY
ncbi:uncharacterized protein CBL_12922 [Carabus blaptoides fortunei]